MNTIKHKQHINKEAMEKNKKLNKNDNEFTNNIQQVINAPFYNFILFFSLSI